MPALRDTIADDLQTQIATGHLEAGARLLSEPQLATYYKVGTPTLHNALALLQAEGLIEKIHGRGNFVRRSLLRLTYIDSCLIPSEDLRLTIRTTQLHARGDLTTLLQVPSCTPLTEFRCLTYEGETPHSLARIYIPPRLDVDRTASAPPRAGGIPREG
ncbi:GntR family transcriptional regulator [Streptomyces hydrogenans]|uniref:GntR family transcriptional regulator n=1 Tax=Streptomyces hydrogenans TaxID=1873719 RepID=UPI0035DE0966